MRASVAILLSIVMLFVMITAMGTAAQESESAAVTNGDNASEDAWNFGNDLYNGVGQALAPSLVFGGIAAIILISLGLLLNSGR